MTNSKEPAGYYSPLFVAVDGNGDVWFTQPSSDALGEFDPQDQSWQQWQLKQGSSPFDLTFDTHGNLWFTEFGTNDIGFFDPRTHTLLENPIPTPPTMPYALTADPHRTDWLTAHAT